MPLTITEAAGAFPPSGRLPSIENNPDAHDQVARLFNVLLETHPEYEPAWPWIVIWADDTFPRTYPSWALAAQAGLAAIAKDDQLAQANRPPVSKIGAERTTQEVKDRPKITMSQITAKGFANCGQTVVLILDQLQELIPALGPMRKSPEIVEYSVKNHEDLRTAFGRIPAPGNVLLIDCSFPAVHTFLIEVHPDGRRYLIQGYQGAYLASWWKGTDDHGLFLTPPIEPKPGSAKYEQAREKSDRESIQYTKDLTALQDIRDRYGLDYPYSETDHRRFVDGLVAAFAEGTWSSFSTQWVYLPFCPTSAEVLSTSHRGEVPTLQITQYEVPNPIKSTTSICFPLVPDVVPTTGL